MFLDYSDVHYVRSGTSPDHYRTEDDTLVVRRWDSGTNEHYEEQQQVVVEEVFGSGRDGRLISKDARVRNLLRYRTRVGR